VPASVSNYVVESYVKLRKLSRDEEHQKKSHTYTSARTLLGILRLAQALARLRFSETVEEPDVDEALRLMDVSKESLADDVEREGGDFDRSAVSKIFKLIKEMAAATRAAPRKSAGRKRAKRIGKGPAGERDMDVDSDEGEEEELSLVDVRSRVLRGGFTELQLQETLDRVGAIQHFTQTKTYHFFSTKRWTFSCVSRMDQKFALSMPHDLIFVPFISTLSCMYLYVAQINALVSTSLLG
jgi:DNA replicative helicase MCM subunit Mcm2 (Cdc46/Mcm family)